MITYPGLVAAVEGLDLDELARRAGVPVAELRDIVAGGWIAAPVTRVHLARALGVDVDELFRAVSEPSGADLEPALPADRYVTDQATLRAVDRAPVRA